jgi:hypothetical protein
MVSQSEKMFYACMLCGLAHTNEETFSWLAIHIRECYKFDGRVHMKGKKNYFHLDLESRKHVW